MTNAEEWEKDFMDSIEAKAGIQYCWFARDYSTRAHKREKLVKIGEYAWEEVI